jgi:thiol-disulfide isomerase/thioredoxin
LNFLIVAAGSGKTELSQPDMIRMDFSCSAFLEMKFMRYLRPILCRQSLLLFAVLVILGAGCTPTDSGNSPGTDLQPTDLKVGDLQANGPEKNQAEGSGPRVTSEPMQRDDMLRGDDAGMVPDDNAVDLNASSNAAPQEAKRFPLAVVDDDFQNRNAGGVDSAGAAAQRTLRADLTAEQLVEFLATADNDMKLIVSGASGMEDPAQRRRTLLQIIQMKQEASRRLAVDENASDRLRSEGRRGQLQALSHLASLGDLKAAERLKTMAINNLDSDDDLLVSDSQLVLIGFGIEDLQNGVDSAPRQIVDWVRRLASTASKSDVPAMMVMGQARQSLVSYGHDEQAKEVRDTIIDLFADSPDPKIAKMAAMMAGNVRFDGIDSLLNRIIRPNDSPETDAISDPDVTVQAWTEAAETLIDESADLQTVQYLSGAAVEFESRGKTAWAEATYDVMQGRFTDQESASFRELTMAIDAYRSRQNAVGREFDFSLPSVDGGPLSMSDYRGKVVLMPFWTIDFPQSLQILPALKQWVDKHPDNLVVVGMNLDADPERVQVFTRKSGLDFRSFRAPNRPLSSGDAASSSDLSGGNPNPAAAQFGVVSLPCVAVFDRQGKVVKIDFAGRQLQETLDRLLDL